MEVHIRLVRNSIKSSRSYGKYFAKTVSQGEVTLKDLAAEACRNCSASTGDVILVLTELEDMLKQRLAEGQTVRIEGIGSFSLRVKSIGVDDPKTFNLGRHIKRIVCRFLLASHRRHDHRISYNFSEGVKTVWQIGAKP